MKTFSKIISLLLLLFATHSLFAQQIARVQELKIHSDILNQERPILVYTPMFYDDYDLVSYDVIYVFDAQNREIFDLVHSMVKFVDFPQKYIVVGICSPAYNETEYYRNSDYAPKPINNPEHYLSDKPNSENFWRYVQQEVFPYIESNYKTTQTRYAIGHSLSASFVLDKVIHTPEAFKGYVAISPNFYYDESRLANDFIANDFSRVKENKFLYTSQADEAVSMPEAWGIAYEKVKNFIAGNNEWGKFTLITNEFPTEDHQRGYAPALLDALKKLARFIENNPTLPAGKIHTVTFKVNVPNKTDEAYITGNQPLLGNWNPAAVKMKKVSDFEREITLNVQFPIEFKITGGSWSSQAATNQNNLNNIVIAKPASTIPIKVEGWYY